MPFAVLTALVSAMLAPPASHATATFTVNSRNDANDGSCNATHCSLREAINAANAAAGGDTIRFSIGGAAPFVIRPSTALPLIKTAITIDGTSQPGYAGVPLVELDGSHVPAGVDGLTISGPSSSVLGLAVYGFPTGIRITGSKAVIRRDRIGTNGAGVAGLGNAGIGIFVLGPGNTIGGLAAGDGNLITGNGDTGVRLSGTQATGNVVDGNEIRGNGADGIMLRPGAVARIRRNVLAANAKLGIDLLPVGVTPNDPTDGDTGPNGLQNFPVLASAEAAGDTTTIQGSLASLPSATFTVDLFDSAACDGSGNGEAGAYLTSVSVTTPAAGAAGFTAAVASAKAPVGSVITATAIHSGGNTSELSACRKVVDAEPPPPPLDHPNIVLVLSDDQSPESLPQTPAVLPWLQSQIQDPTNHFVQLPNTYANTSMCCPARASILTGQYSHHTHVQTNGQGEMLDESSTIATWLQDAGYHTGLVGKYLNDYPFLRGHYIPPGWDSFVGWEGPSGHPYYDYDLNVNGSPVHHGTDPEDYSTDVYKAHALDFLDAAPTDAPFFLYFAPNAPHAPRTAAPRHSELWNNDFIEHNPAFNEADVSDKPQWVQDLPPLGASGIKQQDRFRRAQYASLAAVDEAIKAIVDEVKARGQWNNTVFVYMTDNGVAFGENRWDSKLCPYVTCMRTPMFVRYPTQAARIENRLVSNVDLAPTFAALAEVPPGGPVDGRNLVPLITKAPDPWREEVLIEWVGGVPEEPIPGYWGLYTDSYLYVEYVTGEIELYDMAGVKSAPDPYLLANRCPGSTPACSPVYAPVQADLAARLALLKP